MAFKCCVTPSAKVEKIVASDFFINSGTSFTVQGNENASEHARFDFIRFEPVGEGSPNTPPVAANDTRSTNENADITVNVLNNDTDADGDALTVTSVNTNGTLGQVVNNGNGTLSYSPNGAFNSLNAGETDTDSFSYTISDGNGGFDTATVTVTIEGVNDGPGGSAVTIEAEDIVNVSGYRLENKPAASGGQMLSLLGQSGNEVGTATFSFNGPSGNYDVVIGTFDESDGNASIDFLQGNNLIGSASLNQNPGGNGASADTKVAERVTQRLKRS